MCTAYTVFTQHSSYLIEENISLTFIVVHTYFKHDTYIHVLPCHSSCFTLPVERCTRFPNCQVHSQSSFITIFPSIHPASHLFSYNEIFPVTITLIFLVFILILGLLASALSLFSGCGSNSFFQNSFIRWLLHSAKWFLCNFHIFLCFLSCIISPCYDLPLLSLCSSNIQILLRILFHVDPTYCKISDAIWSCSPIFPSWCFL